jgi:hypothetical protein
MDFSMSNEDFFLIGSIYVLSLSLMQHEGRIAENKDRFYVEYSLIDQQ